MDSLFTDIAKPVIAVSALIAHWKLCNRARAMATDRGPRWTPAAVGAWRWIGLAWLSLPLLWVHPATDLWSHQHPRLLWMQGTAVVLAVGALAAFAVMIALHTAPAHRPSRRRFLTMAGAATAAAPLAVGAFGIIVERCSFRLVEVNMPIPGLPRDLQGLRIVQLSDLHLSAFLSGEDLDRVVDMANETRAGLAVVTGDLITVEDHLLTECLRRLQRLRADAGVLGCLGNHEIVANCEARTQTEGAALGIDFLRGEARALRFGDATLNVAGVDYQRTSKPYLAGAESLVQPDAVNLLLSHNPDVFDAAADQGWDVTLAGHTHGGQVAVEMLQQYLNPALFFTPYVYGFYRKEKSAIYVTRGIGTVGIPVRIGAPPEVALIRLCAT